MVDHLGRDAPDHVPGELWIGGAGVAHGYRGDPERTADRFVEHAGLRWYRTGDMARYLPDGTVEFLGRRDDQVKINGFRVELGEVEAAATAIDGVERAVAVVVGERETVLALAVHGTAGPDDVAGGLRESLPPHMLPRAVVALDQVPLTTNGKIDRRAVRKLVADRVDDGDAGYVPPATALERVVARAFAAVLETDRVGVETSLFALGGDSVLVTVIVSRLRELLDTDAISARIVFAAPTVRGVAEALRAGDPDRMDAVASVVDEVESMTDDDVERDLAGRA